MEKIPLCAIVGPTATGKTALAAELAVRLNGEVISADSMQVYRKISVATAKPTEKEMRGVRHHLIDILDPDEEFSVARYVDLAEKAVLDIAGRKKLPIIAGGTGLYVTSLLEGINFHVVPADFSIRKKLADKADREGGKALLNDLRAVDPETAEKIDVNNLPRIIRALEIYETSGLTPSEQCRRSRENPSPYDACVIGLTYADRQNLYEHIDRRVDQMLQNGLEKEIDALRSCPMSRTVCQAIGVKELFPYFNGEISLEKATEQIKQSTRRYAKRQLTWFNHHNHVQWLYVDDGNLTDIADRAEALLREKNIIQ